MAISRDKYVNFPSERYFKYIFILFFISLLILINVHSYNPIKIFVVLFIVALWIIKTIRCENDFILSNKILIVFGLLSYSLYLWHYVLLSFSYIFGFNSCVTKITLMIFSILLSILTFRFIESPLRKTTKARIIISMLILLSLVGLTGYYVNRSKGLPNRTFLNSQKNKEWQKQFIREQATNKDGKEIVKKVLGYMPTNNYIKATTNDLNSRFLLIIGDSHAETSYPGFAEIAKKHGFETLLLANSSCPPYLDAPMGKNISDMQKCEKKINDIYTIINALPNIKKIIFLTRGPIYMYDIGYGVIDDGGKPINYHFRDFFMNKRNYNQKEAFFKAVSNTFEYFNKRNIKFYYVIEDPELGFSPKNCMIRPFNIFPSKCKLPLKAYNQRAGEYRKKIYKIAKYYKNIIILDPKDLYCDNKYCYAIRDGKMLYADDDHYSVDGSIMQAKYFVKDIFR